MAKYSFDGVLIQLMLILTTNVKIYKFYVTPEFKPGGPPMHGETKESASHHIKASTSHHWSNMKIME